MVPSLRSPLWERNNPFRAKPTREYSRALPSKTIRYRFIKGQEKKDLPQAEHINFEKTASVSLKQ